MMTQLLKPSDYITMPWKNGQGSTAQIHLVPESAQFPQDEFLWRISSAQVSGENQFSQFPGYDRWLSVWQGAGLLLNEQKLEAFAPRLFAGETPIHCQPLSSDVIDLGAIFRRGQVTAQMTAEHLASQQSRSFTLAQGSHYFFCAQGHLAIETLSANSGSTLHIDVPSEDRLDAATKAKTQYEIKNKLVLRNPGIQETRFFHIYLRKISVSEISS